ncbi:MAG: glycoside hydrolase family 127 protein [Acidobacteriaceae bacterium]|nr:glycoside hydrolase family 127 protein [Acidobacteriaceae bacterium]
MAGFSRRRLLQAGSFAAAAATVNSRVWGSIAAAPLAEFAYGDVTLVSEPHEAQLKNTHAVLMSLSDDSLLKPFRQMAGLPAPGEDMGGWYQYDPNYDIRKHSDVGFCPGATFGQWMSALARYYAITGDEATRKKVLRLNRLYARTISSSFYEKTRFPSYTFDKLVIGLIDSHSFAKDPQALEILNKVTDTALPHLPPRAIEQHIRWRMDKDPADESWTWDESYTLPENLFLAYRRGAGRRYYDLARQYLFDKGWFDPLSQNENVLYGKHAYSHVNSMSSAMMAYMVAGSEKHLRAACNGFAMVRDQSFATGGWGPDEQLRSPGSDGLYDSLTKTHSSFETPCGSYAHFKLTRYLLRVTRDSRYGDSMERMMYNTVLGARPLQEDGQNFYYSDYNFNARRVDHWARWACCSGTLPQVVADYRINAYFRGPGAVYVNLYLPSTLRWKENGAALTLTQAGEYPYEDHVNFTMTASRPTELTVCFRIPAWAEGASISVNGSRQKEPVVPGQFAAVRRTWTTGDQVTLELPLKTRLESIDPKHTDTVALLRGPLVLMAVKPAQDAPLPKVTREQLLAAKRTGREQWQVQSADGPVAMQPFTALSDQPYTAYLKMS